MDVVFRLRGCGPRPDEAVVQEVGSQLSRAAEENGMRFERLTYDTIDPNDDSLEDEVWELVHKETGDAGLADRVSGTVTRFR